MIENIIIRRLGIKDVRSLKEVRLESLKKSPVNFGSSYEDEILFEDKDWINRLSNNDVVTFGAFINFSIVGSITLGLSNRLKTKHNAEIHGMYVNELNQKKGIGYKLINTLIDYAKGIDFVEMLSLSVESGNYKAINLYEKVGFKRVALVPYALKIDNSFHSFIMMNKILYKNNENFRCFYISRLAL